MAKPTYTKLKLSVNTEIKNVNWEDQNIEIKQYLPFQEKLELVSTVINLSADDNRFYNQGKLDMFLSLYIIYNYTNITFTDKQKEDPVKLYDAILSSAFLKLILENIPTEEISYLKELLFKTISQIYDYQHSAMGIMESISQDYSNLDLDASKISEKLSDPEQLTLLKDVMTKLG